MPSAFVDDTDATPPTFYRIASPFLTFVVSTVANPSAFAKVLNDQVHKME